MPLRSLLFLLACLLSLLAVPAAAHAATPVIGYGDERAEMLSDPLFSSLGIRDSRIAVEWDTFRYPEKTARLDAWMAAARAARVRPLIAIEHSWTPGRQRLAPTPAQYTTLVRTLRGPVPGGACVLAVERGNPASQPTARRPDLAARYWRLMRAALPGATVTSPVYLDLQTRSSKRWLQSFKKATGGRVRLWAIHGYGDLNRGTDRRNLSALLKQLPGQVWVTEAAGWVAFGTAWKYNEARAARSISYTFKLVRKHPRQGHALVLLPVGAACRRARAGDSGVVGANGQPRPGYRALKAGLAAR